MKRLMSIVLVLLVVLMAFGCGSSQQTSTEPQTSTEEEVGFFEEEVYFERTVETPVYYTKDEIKIDPTYTLKENGNTYIMELKEQSIVEAPIGSRTATLQYSETFVDVKEEEIPQKVTVKYQEDGMTPIQGTIVLKDKNGTLANPPAAAASSTPAEGNNEASSDTQKGYTYTFDLPLVNKKPGEQVWIEFSAPMSFTDYGAAYYKLNSNTYLPHRDSAPVVDGYEDAILEYLGLSPYSYRISYAAWDGGTYTNSNGVLCRDALMYGERLVGTMIATYEDTVPLETVTGYKGKAVYSYRGIVRNQKKVATVAGGSAAVVGAGTIIPIVFFRRRRKKDEEADS